LELLKLVPPLQGGDKPSRLLSPAGPRFCRRHRVAIFRQDLWVLAAGSTIGSGPRRGHSHLTEPFGFVEFRQTTFQFAFLRLYFLRQYFREFLMNEPELI